MSTRRAFIAGSSGATGRTLQAIASRLGIEVLPHLRRKSAHKAPEQAAVFDLSETEELRSSLETCTTVVQLIGTMRKRFADGDNYQSSDIETTRFLVEAAQHTEIKHFILLSSVGASQPRGAYLKAKATAEAIVTASGLAYTIFRPSMFEGDYHGRIPGLKRMTKMLGLKRYEPIKLEQLAGTILRVAQSGQPTGCVLEGADLWSEVDAATQAGFCGPLS